MNILSISQIVMIALASVTNACGGTPSFSMNFPTDAPPPSRPENASSDVAEPTSNSSPTSDSSPAPNAPADSSNSDQEIESSVANTDSNTPSDNSTSPASDTVDTADANGTSTPDSSSESRPEEKPDTTANSNIEPSSDDFASSTTNILYRSDVDPHLTAQVSLDVHYSERNKTKPVFVFIHGGGWISGDKAEAVDPQVSQLGDFVRDRGYVLVSINYRLVNIEAFKQNLPSPTYMEQASDIAHAIGWVKANISNYGGNPDQIILSGHSAGAHLAPLVVLDNRFLNEVGLDATAIRKVISLDVHAYDIPLAISLMSTNATFSAQIPSLKMMFGQTADKQLEASPSHYISAGRNLPTFLVLSAARMRGTVHDLTIKTSQAFVEKLQMQGYEAAHYSYEDESHSSIVSDLSTAGDQPASVLKEFLKL